MEFGALTNQESKLYIQKITENYREKQLGKILGKILGKTRKNKRIEKKITISNMKNIRFQLANRSFLRGMSKLYSVFEGQ